MNGLILNRKPDKTAPFREYLKYYMDRKGWSQSRLSVNARINQPRLNKIINGKVSNINIDVLVCICLALQLSLKESKDLLARAERAFSPACKLHSEYQILIERYSIKPLERSEDCNMLIEADDYLTDKGLPTLPDANCD